MRSILITAFLLLFSLNSYAGSVIDVTQGNNDPVPIAINKFSVSNGNIKLATDIVQVITNDLKGSGIFKPISPAAFLDNQIGISHTPLFAAWQQVNANLLINGNVQVVSGSKIRIQFILWDTILHQKLFSETFELPSKLWRRGAHKVADSIYYKITGYEGYFDTRIAYVAESGPYTKRVKRIAIMDQDGANHQYLTDGSDLVLTPRFSPKGDKLLYLSYKTRHPRVFLLDIATKKSRMIGKFPGMSFAPRFSPDGEYAIMSIARNGITHIYELHFKTGKMLQLTHGSSINTSPSYSSDGKYIVFQSDRSGSRQLYIMNRIGLGARQISFNGARYAEPNWSSTDFITFTKVSRTHGFTIGVIRPDNSADNNNERLITSGYLVETPAWSPNGRVVIFTKGAKPRRQTIQPGLNRIHTIDFTGYNERIVPTPHDASDPDWSKPLD